MRFTEHYSEIKNHAPRGLRGTVRHLALHGLSLGQRVSGGAKLFARPRIQFLYIHHVFRDEENGLRRLIRALEKQHHFISYSEAVERVLNNNIDKPYIAFSSDDGFLNNLVAGRILKDAGISACFFLNPGTIAEKDPEKIKQFNAERLHFPPVEFMDWKDVKTLQGMGHEIGSHTMHHINMATTNDAELKKELMDSKKILQENCGEINHFAFPYGRFSNFSEKARSLVFETGYNSCATAERGCHFAHAHRPDPEKLAIHRDHVVLAWPLEHTLYFMARNAAEPPRERHFPYRA
jgi:peptidoglycan/xylan/chitin deacetylase (PgdA/CDA1 family)